MLRNMNVSVNGKRDSTDPRVGVLASEIPTGFARESFLLNDIDPAYPNRLYSLKLLTLPQGEFYLNKAGVGYYLNPPAGDFVGTEQVNKYDPGIGLVSSGEGTYSLQIRELVLTPKVTNVSISPITATGSRKFVAVVQGENNPSLEVTWSKSGPGTITDDGDFTAPNPISTVQTVVIRATSVEDPSKYAEATVTIAAVIVIVPIVDQVIIQPQNAIINEGGFKQYTGTVVGDNNPSQELTWESTLGDISENGLLTVGNATLVDQIGIVKATSIYEPTKFGVSTFTIPAKVVIPDDPDIPQVDPLQVVIPTNRILRTVAGNFYQREGTFDGDTFYLSQGVWVIDKDKDDILFYALDLEPDLEVTGTTLNKASCIVEGVTVNVGPLIKGKMVIIKVKGGDSSGDFDAVNCVTFRIVCNNGEVYDRSIYFNIQEH